MDQAQGEREWGVTAEKGEDKEVGFQEHAGEDVGVEWYRRE
jgi:hypothetical protein